MTALRPISKADQVFQDLGRNEAIARAKEIASTRALAAGARESTLSVTEVEDLPLALPAGRFAAGARAGDRGCRLSMGAEPGLPGPDP